jgi:hypothetical protein
MFTDDGVYEFAGKQNKGPKSEDIHNDRSYKGKNNNLMNVLLI